jgi:FixJ family two-component response regulator
MTDNEELVYVIDDDESVLKAFQSLLWSAGFTVQAFPSAEKFLEKADSIDN